MHGQNYGQLIIILITDIYLLTISQQDIYIIHPFTIERPLPFRNLIPVKKFACMYPVILVPVNISPLKLHKTHTSFFFFFMTQNEKFFYFSFYAVTSVCHIFSFRLCVSFLLGKDIGIREILTVLLPFFFFKV